MSQSLIKPKFMRVQSYGDVLSITVSKPFAEELKIEKQSTVKTWVDNGVFHAKRAE